MHSGPRGYSGRKRATRRDDLGAGAWVNQSFTLPAVRLDKVTNLVSVPGLLFEELIAGEGKHFQSLIPVIIDQVGKLCVIRFGQTSFRGHVDHNQDVTDVLRHVDDRAVEESIGERRELRI